MEEGKEYLTVRRLQYYTSTSYTCQSCSPFGTSLNAQVLHVNIVKIQQEWTDRDNYVSCITNGGRLPYSRLL